MSYFVVTATKQTLLKIQKKFKPEYATELYLVFKEVPKEVAVFPGILLSSITEEEFQQILVSSKTADLKEGHPVICIEGIYKRLVGILRKINQPKNGGAITCTVEISTGGGMLMDELPPEQIKQIKFGQL